MGDLDFFSGETGDTNLRPQEPSQSTSADASEVLSCTHIGAGPFGNDNEWQWPHEKNLRVWEMKFFALSRNYMYTYCCTEILLSDHTITYWFKQKVWKQELLWTAILGECTQSLLCIDHSILTASIILYSIKQVTSAICQSLTLKPTIVPGPPRPQLLGIALGTWR